jgi:hypothetical protein
VILILWIRVRLKGVAGPEYARLNTGASITRGNSGNGALPTRDSEQSEDKDNTGQITDVRASWRLSRNDSDLSTEVRRQSSEAGRQRMEIGTQEPQPQF